MTAAESRFLEACRVGAVEAEARGLLTVSFLLITAYAANALGANTSPPRTNNTRRASEQTLLESRVRRGVCPAGRGRWTAGCCRWQTRSRTPRTTPTSVWQSSRSSPPGSRPGRPEGVFGGEDPSRCGHGDYRRALWEVPEAALADLGDAHLGGDRDRFLKSLGTVYAARIDAKHQLLLASSARTWPRSATPRQAGRSGRSSPPMIWSRRGVRVQPRRQAFHRRPGRSFKNAEAG